MWEYVVLLLLNSILIIMMVRDKRVNLFMKILLCVSYFGWNALPLILTAFTDQSFHVIQINKTLYFFCNVANQIFLFFTYLIAYLLILSRPIPKWIVSRDFQNNANFIKLFTNISLVGLVYSIIRLIYSTALYRDFDLEQFSNDTEIGPITFITSFCRFFLLAMLIFKRNTLNHSQQNIIIVLLLLFYMLQTLSGSRISIFGILFLFIYISLEQKNYKNMVYTCIFLILAFLLLPIIGDLRQNDTKITVSQVVEKGGVSSIDRIISELVVKTNSVDYSTFLLASDGIGNAGANVYLSQFYSLIPRFVYPNKPFGGSKDGTVMGSYARYAANTITGQADETGYNVGVSTSIIALWSLGWPMFIVHILISGYFIFLFNSIFVSRKPLFVLFVLFSLNYPVCQLDISFDIIIRDIQRYLVIYFILRLCYPRIKRYRFTKVWEKNTLIQTRYHQL